MSQALSPAPTILAALVAALTSDPGLQSILASPGVYSGRAPKDAAMPMIVIGDLNTLALPTFDGRNGQGQFRINLWAKDIARVLELYAAVALVIDREFLDLSADEFAQIDARLELVTTIADPAASAGHQAIVNYAWSAQFTGNE